MINLLVYIEVLSCGRHVTHNNIGPQLSYDWLLQKNPENPPWEVLLKIKRYGTGLTPGQYGRWKSRVTGFWYNWRYNVAEREICSLALLVFLDR